MNDLILTKNSPVYKIFHYPFHCKVPRYSTFSYDDLKRYGSYSTTDEETAAYLPIEKLITINDMIEYRKEGIPIELSKPRESGAIYEIIVEHLKMWRDYGVNYGMPYEPPMDDLYLLDELAKSVFVLALTYGGKKEREEDLFDVIGGYVPLGEEDICYDIIHENVMAEIQELKELYGEYTRYGY